jgi:hypothetical protein
MTKLKPIPTAEPKLIPAEGTIVKKAYEIDLDKLDEGYLFSPTICYAENANKAKSKLLKDVQHHDWTLKYSYEVLNYLNIPVKRCKSADKVIFEGKEVTRCSIKEIIEERERIARLDEILNNPNIIYCYIRKGSYYRPNSCGYTSHLEEAGVYPKEEAVKHAKSVREIRIEWCDVQEHNQRINDKIRDLTRRLL